jgi:hypothetical protein
VYKLILDIYFGGRGIKKSELGSIFPFGPKTALSVLKISVDYFIDFILFLPCYESLCCDNHWRSCCLELLDKTLSCGNHWRSCCLKLLDSRA